MIPIRDNIPSRRFPVINVAIIIACVGVFFAQFQAGPAAQEWAFRPEMLLPWRGPTMLETITALFLSMFMHGGIAHIGGNMLFLWVFGDNIEDRMGHVKYLVFYLICGIIATLAHSAFALFTGTAHIASSAPRARSRVCSAHTSSCSDTPASAPWSSSSSSSP